jgi:hypothetical protein
LLRLAWRAEYRWPTGCHGARHNMSSCIIESRLKVVNKTKLKFSKIITTTSRVSVRNIVKSAREGAKQIASE